MSLYFFFQIREYIHIVNKHKLGNEWKQKYSVY